MYGTSSSLIIVSIIVLAIALIVAIVAYRSLNPAIPSNNTNGDINNIKGVLMFFIIIDSIMLLVSFYALAKVRTSSVGGWWGFILGLIIFILVLIFGISAINKIDPVAYPWVLRGLVFNTVMISLVFFLLILSVFTKPKICSGNIVKKVYQGMKNKMAECRPVKEECAPIKEIPCLPQPIANCAPVQQMQNCAPQYLNSTGQISQYIQNPYLPQ